VKIDNLSWDMGNKSKAVVCMAVGLLVLILPMQAHALGEPKYVSATTVKGGFALEAEGKAAPLVVSDADWPGVVRVVGDLAFGRSGKGPGCVKR
jgi:hypothetical protein